MGIFKRLLKRVGKDEAEEADTAEEEKVEVDDGDGKEDLAKDKEYVPEDIIIRFRAHSGDEAVDLTEKHDFTKIPTKEEIKELFGPGSYTIFTKEKSATRPLHRGRFTIEGNPTLLVDHYEFKVRVKKGGKLLPTDTKIPGPERPTREIILSELDGGGFIKLIAIDENGKTLWSEWLDYSDEEPSLEFVKLEESFEGRVAKAIGEKKREAEDTVLKTLGGVEGGKDKNDGRVETSLERIITVLEDKKMEHLEDALTHFVERLDTPGGKDPTSSNTGIAELAFKKPYQAKLDAQTKIIEELAKKNPAEAMKMLDKMPDGISIALKLALAGTGLVEALTDSFKDQTEATRTRRKEKKKARPRGDEKQKEGGRAKTPVESEIEKKLGRDSAIEMERIEYEKGFEVTFNIGGVGEKDGGEG